MRPLPALLVSGALAASVVSVPATAQADATGVRLAAEFDQLARDRVVKLKVNASSASGVTAVRARMRHQTPEGEPYATVEFTRTGGTANEGVWEAEFRPDIDKHPGINRVEVLITTADGQTATHWHGFVDCYTTSIADLTATPGVIDIENSAVTLRGRVLVQKHREAPPAPAPGATVQGPASAKTTTGADGSFALNYSGAASAAARVPLQGQLCAATANAPLTVNQQSTEITAKMSPASPVAPYTDMVVQGKVVRHGSTGPAPVAGIEVDVNAPSAVVDRRPRRVQTSADGTFRTTFTAGRNTGASGTVTARVAGTQFLTGSQAELGTLNIRNTAEITGFNAFPEPLAYGDPIITRGRLTLTPDFNNSTNLPLYLEYSFDRKTWKTWATRTLARPGDIHFNADRRVTKAAHWRIRFPGDAHNAPAVTPTDYVDVKYRTQLYNFNASPEPVKKGANITVKGQLYRFRAESEPAPNAKIHIYFKPKGSSTWTKMAITKTAKNGWFNKKFKASKDGTWLARYWGSSTYLDSNYLADYVDVR